MKTTLFLRFGLLDLWCSHTHTNFKKSQYMIFVRHALLKASQFRRPSYVGMGYV